MVARDSNDCGVFYNCFEYRFSVAHRDLVFGHWHATTPDGHCSFLLWAQQLKSYLAAELL